MHFDEVDAPLLFTQMRTTVCVSLPLPLCVFVCMHVGVCLCVVSGRRFSLQSELFMGQQHLFTFAFVLPEVIGWNVYFIEILLIDL